MHRLLVIYDCDGWAYHRRANALKRYAPSDFHVDICPIGRMNWATVAGYEIIFNLEYSSPSRKAVKRVAPNVPLVVSYNSDSARRAEFWPRVTQEADFVVCNNMDVFEHHKRQKKTCCISNGVDIEIFRPTVPIEEREHRIFWRGSSGTHKGKGWQEYLQPAMDRLRALGFEPDFLPIDRIDERVLATEPLVAKYNQCSYVLCMSSTEGTPNFVSEGVACGCVAVSTNVGNIREWGREGENCVIVERSIDAMIDGLCYAREHRERLSVAGHETIQGWAYGPPGNRAAVYYSLFRRILAEGVGTIEPFSYQEAQ